MNNNLLRLHIKEGLNKLDSGDYDNLECWQLALAFNRVQLEWCRREIKKAESTKTNVDDLAVIVRDTEIEGINKKKYFETHGLPSDFLAVKRISITASNDFCTQDGFKVYEGEESNVDDLLRNENKNPNFEWAETFKTHIDNKIRIYTDNKFKVDEAKLTYYRKPRNISFEDCVNEYNELTSDQECEFKDDIVYLLISETCALLAGSTENMNQYQVNMQNAQRQA